MLLRSWWWPARQRFPKPFLLICLPLMRNLKARYFLSLPFLQLTVTETSCMLGGIMWHLEGDFCVRFSSLIRVQREESVPLCGTWPCLTARCFGVRMSHAWGHCTGSVKSESSSSVPETHMEVENQLQGVVFWSPHAWATSPVCYKCNRFLIKKDKYIKFSKKKCLFTKIPWVVTTTLGLTILGRIWVMGLEGAWVLGHITGTRQWPSCPSLTSDLQHT